ncbi:MAG: acyl-CoA carboxylase subunit beta [Clostridiales bacterium]|nr:acyl-CoA carboxylase subunit beta [Clostridiales bacterium]MCF8023278.1 acyl-CoA carboxylase subunit beta [Clostridiales bacterium]
MNIQERLKQLKQLKEIVHKGGGEKRIQKQYNIGKKTARERVNLLFDEGSFNEVNVFATNGDMKKDMENPGEGVITGYGNVNGRLVYAFAQDFTVAGGSLGVVHAEKICKMLDMALKTGAPVIGLEDSGGARIQEGVEALNGYGEIFYRNTMASGVIPQISVIMGPCAGGAVYSPAITDFVFMVKNTSQMFITGPQVIKAVTGEEVSMEQLGGADTHNQTSGVAHFSAEDEEQCVEMIKQLLSFLPSNNLEDSPSKSPVDPQGDPEELLNIVPGNPHVPYDVKKIINLVVDCSEFFEVHSEFAKNAVVGFARMNGKTVGIIGNQPDSLAGCLDIDASDKIARFVRFCDSFNISLVTFMDVPGFLPGTKQEYGGIIRHGAKILYSYSEATVPKVTVILRKAYGGAYIGMCSSSLKADIVFAWPTGEIAVMGPEGAVNIIYRNEIKDADKPDEKRNELVQEYREKFANPFVAASKGYVDDVIDPRETREKIITSLSALDGKRVERPRKKHGNIPL